MSYVSFNAVKHEIVENINDYKWTSYHQLSKNQKVMKYRNLELRELEL